MGERSTELYFHEFLSADSSDIYITPLEYVIHNGQRFLVFPYAGLDLFMLTTSGFWVQHEHITMELFEELVEKMELFHIRYKLAIGDISPWNIVYDAQLGTGRFIDLELLKAPIENVVPPEPAETLHIDIPGKDVYIQSFSREGTPGFCCFDKLFSATFDVFENDRYALATTLYTMITNRVPPTLYASDSCTRDEWYRLHEVALEHLLMFMHYGCYHWSIESRRKIVDYIRTAWKRRLT